MKMNKTVSPQRDSFPPLIGTIRSILFYSTTFYSILFYSRYSYSFKRENVSRLRISVSDLHMFMLFSSPHSSSLFLSFSPFIFHFLLFLSELVSSGWPWKGGITLEGVSEL